MASRIEARFRAVAEKDNRFRSLLGQWEIDQQLIFQALSNVSHTFPHYSTHDATHSEVIFSRIASVLGSGLDQLGGTDLWLLLESAYLHDAGMITNAETRRKDLQSPQWATFLKQMSIRDDDLGRACQEVGNLTALDSAAKLDEKHRHFVVAYSEFVRRTHPKRAEAAVLSPETVIDTKLPRNHLIPSRFWHLIGGICRAHGEDRKAVFDLPYQENGIGEDICHPRFVAAMLRLGDLLDLDSDRFCPSVNAMIKPLPDMSEVHQRKHAGIRHVLINTNRIEVEGVYDDVDAYLEAERWFNSLREELTAYTLNWDQIDPVPSVGHLPSAGVIEARLERQVVLTPGARPRLELDRDKVLALVRGANLYEGPQDAIREILQNAIDATLLRFSYESQCDADGAEMPASPSDLRKLLKDYPIDVTFKRLPDDPADPKNARWQVIIRDRGIGMRLDDIRYVLSLGSSSRNEYRNRLREWLPQWARPSGSFGIGLHSIFEYTRKATFTTRHASARDKYELKFESRQVGAEPHVLIQTVANEGDFPEPAGTTVDFELSVERLPQPLPFLGYEDADVRQAVESFDFVCHEEMEYIPAQIRARIRSLAKDSLCAIRLNGELLTGTRDATMSQRFEGGLEIALRQVGLTHMPVSLKYRGAGVKGDPDFPMLKLECNVHAGDASELLELSRNRLTAVGYQKVMKSLSDVVPRLVDDWSQELGRQGRTAEQKLLSLYRYTNLPDSDGETDWRTTELEFWGLKLTVGQIAESPTVEVRFAIPWLPERGKVERQGDRLRLLDFSEREFTAWLPTLMRKQFQSRCLLVEDGRFWYRFEKSATVMEDVVPAALVASIERSPVYFVGNRTLIPCPERFQDLAMPKDGPDSGMSADTFIERRMPNPFVRVKKGLRILHLPELVNWLEQRGKHPRRAVVKALIALLKEVAAEIGERKSALDAADVQEAIALLEKDPALA